MKYKIIIGIILISAGIFVYLAFFKSDAKTTETKNSTPKVVSATDEPQVVATKPDPLEDTIIGANDTIEITFNRPLENVGEFKLRMEDKKDVKVELSGDRKTAKIIPLTPYELGTTYTMFIGPDSKFDGVGNWGKEKIFHFKTIRYTGV